MAKKKPSRKNIVKQLDKIFSIYIRRKDAVENIAECVTCGKRSHYKTMQNGHFMSRKHYSTRWDEDNVGVQCYACNVMRYGEQFIFSKYLGEEKANELLIKSRQIQKFTDNDLIELINVYKMKVEDLDN